MRPKTLLILALAVLVLGAFIWFYERELPGSEERAEQAKKVLGGLESSDVDAVEIAWEDHRVRLEKRSPAAAEDGEGEGEGEDVEAQTSAEERWRLVEPWETRADPTEVSRLLTTLVDLEKRRTLDDPDRAAMGLEPPAATVMLSTGDGERVLQVGGEVPVSKDRIVALAGGSEAYQVRGAVWDDLTRDPGRWRDKRIVRAEQDDIARVELSGGDGEGPVVLARDGDSYRLEAPLRDRADRETVRGFLNRLSNLRAQSFIDDPETEVEDPEALGLDPPRAVVTAEIEGDEPVRVEFGGVADEELERRYGRVGDQVFVFVDRELVEDVERPAAHWRSPTWSGQRVFRIDAVEVEDAAGRLKVERSGSDWMRGEDRIAYGPVSELLYAVTEAEAERLLTPEQAEAEGWPLDAPTHTVRLWVEDDATGDGAEGDQERETGGNDDSEPAPTEVLTLYPPVEAGVPARAGDRDLVLLLPAERRTTLEEAVAGVRDAEPIPEEGDEAVEDDGQDDELEPLDVTEEVGG